MGGTTNGIAALALGLYLGAVLWKGNTDALVEEAKATRQFLPWIFALVVWTWIRDAMPRDIGNTLGAMIALGFLITVGGKVFPAVNRFLKTGSIF